MKYASKTFWLGTAERAIKTGAQTALSGLTLGATIFSVNATEVIGIALGGIVFSILTSLADPDRADTAIATGAKGSTSADDVA